MSHESTGARAAALALRAAGVETVFCLPGEETIALLQAICDADIELIVARHEQHAAFLAATHGRLTGRPGVLITTLGPGATNALTGLAHATLGGFPIVHIAGQKPLRDNWEGSFQVVDLVATTTPVAKAAMRCTDPIEVSTTVTDALHRSVEGRPGAVFVELPADVAQGEIDEAVPPPSDVDRPATVIDDRGIDRIVEIVNGADMPAMIVGGGAQRSDVSLALCRLADRWQIQVVPLQTGIGAIPADHPFALPPIGMHSSDAAHLALEKADVVLAIGFHPDEHPPLAWNRADARVVHVADWPAPIRRGYQPEFEVVADLAPSLDRLAEQPVDRTDDRIAEIRTAIEAQLAGEDLADDDANGVSTIDVVRAVRRAIGHQDIVALDNGSYKLWFARHYDAFAPNTLLLDNALATMGAGLAIGTEAARLYRDRHVVAVVGDGGFMMNIGDLETTSRLGLDNLTIVVLRDDTYGFIADHQRERGADRVAVDVTNPDFVTLAAAFGLNAQRVDSADDLAAAIERFTTTPGAAVIDCRLDELADARLHGVDSLAGARQRLERSTPGDECDD